MYHHRPKKEDNECQTELQCTPFILSENQEAKVHSSRFCQTEVQLSPRSPDTELYNLIPYIDEDDIEKNSIQTYVITRNRKTKLQFILPLSRSSVITLPPMPAQTIKEYKFIITGGYDGGVQFLKESENLNCFSNEDFHKIEQKKPSKEDEDSESKSSNTTLRSAFKKEHKEEATTQTDLMIAPHILKDTEKAIISMNTSCQTSLTCSPATSVTNIVPMLKCYWEHRGEIREGFNKTENALEILKEIIQDVINIHQHMFDPNYDLPIMDPGLVKDNQKASSLHSSEWDTISASKKAIRDISGDGSFENYTKEELDSPSKIVKSIQDKLISDSITSISEVTTFRSSDFTLTSPLDTEDASALHDDSSDDEHDDDDEDDYSDIIERIKQKYSTHEANEMFSSSKSSHSDDSIKDSIKAKDTVSYESFQNKPKTEQAIPNAAGKEITSTTGSNKSDLQKCKETNSNCICSGIKIKLYFKDNCDAQNEERFIEMTVKPDSESFEIKKLLNISTDPETPDHRTSIPFHEIEKCLKNQVDNDLENEDETEEIANANITQTDTGLQIMINAPLNTIFSPDTTSEDLLNTFLTMDLQENTPYPEMIDKVSFPNKNEDSTTKTESCACAHGLKAQIIHGKTSAFTTVFNPLFENPDNLIPFSNNDGVCECKNNKNEEIVCHQINSDIINKICPMNYEDATNQTKSCTCIKEKKNHVIVERESPYSAIFNRLCKKPNELIPFSKNEGVCECKNDKDEKMVCVIVKKSGHSSTNKSTLDDVCHDHYEKLYVGRAEDYPNHGSPPLKSMSSYIIIPLSSVKSEVLRGHFAAETLSNRTGTSSGNPDATSITYEGHVYRTENLVVQEDSDDSEETVSVKIINSNIRKKHTYPLSYEEHMYKPLRNDHSQISDISMAITNLDCICGLKLQESVRECPHCFRRIGPRYGRKLRESNDENEDGTAKNSPDHCSARQSTAENALNTLILPINKPTTNPFYTGNLILPPQGFPKNPYDYTTQLYTLNNFGNTNQMYTSKEYLNKNTKEKVTFDIDGNKVVHISNTSSERTTEETENEYISQTETEVGEMDFTIGNSDKNSNTSSNLYSTERNITEEVNPFLEAERIREENEKANIFNEADTKNTANLEQKDSKYFSGTSKEDTQNIDHKGNVINEADTKNTANLEQKDSKYFSGTTQNIDQKGNIINSDIEFIEKMYPTGKLVVVKIRNEQKNKNTESNSNEDLPTLENIVKHLVNHEGREPTDEEIITAIDTIDKIKDESSSYKNKCKICSKAKQNLTIVTLHGVCSVCSSDNELEQIVKQNTKSKSVGCIANLETGMETSGIKLESKTSIENLPEWKRIISKECKKNRCTSDMNTAEKLKKTEEKTINTLPGTKTHCSTCKQASKYPKTVEVIYPVQKKNLNCVFKTNQCQSSGNTEAGVCIKAEFTEHKRLSQIAKQKEVKKKGSEINIDILNKLENISERRSLESENIAVFEVPETPINSIESCHCEKCIFSKNFEITCDDGKHSKCLDFTCSSLERILKEDIPCTCASSNSDEKEEKVSVSRGANLKESNKCDPDCIEEIEKHEKTKNIHFNTNEQTDTSSNSAGKKEDGSVSCGANLKENIKCDLDCIEEIEKHEKTKNILFNRDEQTDLNTMSSNSAGKKDGANLKENIKCDAECIKGIEEHEKTKNIHFNEEEQTDLNTMSSISTSNQPRVRILQAKYKNYNYSLNDYVNSQDEFSISRPNNNDSLLSNNTIIDRSKHKSKKIMNVHKLDGEYSIFSMERKFESGDSQTTVYILPNAIFSPVISLTPSHFNSTHTENEIEDIKHFFYMRHLHYHKRPAGRNSPEEFMNIIANQNLPNMNCEITCSCGAANSKSKGQQTDNKSTMKVDQSTSITNMQQNGENSRNSVTALNTKTIGIQNSFILFQNKIEQTTPFNKILSDNFSNTPKLLDGQVINSETMIPLKIMGKYITWKDLISPNYYSATTPAHSTFTSIEHFIDYSNFKVDIGIQTSTVLSTTSWPEPTNLPLTIEASTSTGNLERDTSTPGSSRYYLSEKFSRINLPFQSSNTSDISEPTRNKTVHKYTFKTPSVTTALNDITPVLTLEASTSTSLQSNAMQEKLKYEESSSTSLARISPSYKETVSEINTSLPKSPKPQNEEASTSRVKFNIDSNLEELPEKVVKIEETSSNDISPTISLPKIREEELCLSNVPPIDPDEISSLSLPAVESLNSVTELHMPNVTDEFNLQPTKLKVKLHSSSKTYEKESPEQSAFSNENMNQEEEIILSKKDSLIKSAQQSDLIIPEPNMEDFGTNEVIDTELYASDITTLKLSNYSTSKEVNGLLEKTQNLGSKKINKLTNSPLDAGSSRNLRQSTYVPSNDPSNDLESENLLSRAIDAYTAYLSLKKGISSNFNVSKIDLPYQQLSDNLEPEPIQQTSKDLQTNNSSSKADDVYSAYLKRKSKISSLMSIARRNSSSSYLKYSKKDRNFSESKIHSPSMDALFYTTGDIYSSYLKRKEELERNLDKTSLSEEETVEYLKKKNPNSLNRNISREAFPYKTEDANSKYEELKIEFEKNHQVQEYPKEIDFNSLNSHSSREVFLHKTNAYSKYNIDSVKQQVEEYPKDRDLNSLSSHSSREEFLHKTEAVYPKYEERRVEFKRNIDKIPIKEYSKEKDVNFLNSHSSRESFLHNTENRYSKYMGRKGKFKKSAVNEEIEEKDSPLSSILKKDYISQNNKMRSNIYKDLRSDKFILNKNDDDSGSSDEKNKKQPIPSRGSGNSYSTFFEDSYARSNNKELPSIIENDEAYNSSFSANKEEDEKILNLTNSPYAYTPSAVPNKSKDIKSDKFFYSTKDNYSAYLKGQEELSERSSGYPYQKNILKNRSSRVFREDAYPVLPRKSRDLRSKEFIFSREPSPQNITIRNINSANKKNSATSKIKSFVRNGTTNAILSNIGDSPQQLSIEEMNQILPELAESSHRVLETVHSCEQRLQPLKNALKDIKSKLKELNMPEVNGIFQNDQTVDENNTAYIYLPPPPSSVGESNKCSYKTKMTFQLKKPIKPLRVTANVNPFLIKHKYILNDDDNSHVNSNYSSLSDPPYHVQSTSRNSINPNFSDNKYVEQPHSTRTPIDIEQNRSFSLESQDGFKDMDEIEQNHFLSDSYQLYNYQPRSESLNNYVLFSPIVKTSQISVPAENSLDLTDDVFNYRENMKIFTKGDDYPSRKNKSKK